MDVRIEAAPMTAKAKACRAVVMVVTKVVHQAITLIERVASFSCPSMGSHSISAVAPDADINTRGTALSTSCA